MSGKHHPTEGAGPTPFPETNWSGILAARDPSSPEYVDRVNRLARLYWRPVYWYIRLQWNKTHEESKDLTQAFFVQLLERDVFRHADPQRGSFRVFLKAVLKHFLLVEKRAAGRIKRGGGQKALSLDIEEPLAPARGLTPDQTFDREWSRAIMEEAYRRLEAEAKRDRHQEAHKAFRLYYLDADATAPPSYRDVAKKVGITEFQLQNHLYLMRQTLKRIIRELVTDSSRCTEDVEAEMRDLLLQEPP